MKLIKTLCNTANGYGVFTFVAIGVPALYICRKPNIGVKIMPTNEKAIFSTLLKVQKQMQYHNSLKMLKL